MKTIEVIKVRTGNSHSKEVLEVLQQLTADATKIVQNNAVKLYRNDSVTGDYAYFLSWNEEMTELEGSPLGIKIRKTLESLGLVNHTTWSLLEPSENLATTIGR